MSPIDDPKARRMPPAEALRRVEMQPLTLSSGQSLSQALASTYGVKAAEADWLVREYQHFLALALCAPRGEATMPSPLVERVWQTHKDDPSYADFIASLGPEQLSRHHTPRRHSGHPAYKANRAHYIEAFGQITPRWWPSPLWLWAKDNPFALLVIGFVVLYHLVLKPDLALLPGQPNENGAKLFITLLNGVFMIALAQKFTPFARMTASHASYAQAPKATP